jgi:hypothetical protein
MKKPIKYVLYMILGIVATIALILLLANYVFTTKLLLSCSGNETTSVYIGSKLTPIETKNKLEGVSITIVKYPFINNKIIFASNNFDISTGAEDEHTSLTQTQISGSRNTMNSKVEIFRSFSFSRLTKGIEILSLHKSLDTNSGLESHFEGVCTEVKAL